MAHSSLAVDAAQRLWKRGAADAGTPEAIAANVQRICAELRASLGRWIGPGGHRALLHRALERERAEHPVLRSFSCQGGEDSAISAAAQSHGGGAVAAGMVALVATLIELLGRVVGEEMAVRLVEQNVAADAPAAAGSETEGT